MLEIIRTEDIRTEAAVQLCAALHRYTRNLWISYCLGQKASATFTEIPYFIFYAHSSMCGSMLYLLCSSNCYQQNFFRDLSFLLDCSSLSDVNVS